MKTLWKVFVAWLVELGTIDFSLLEGGQYEPS